MALLLLRYLYPYLEEKGNILSVFNPSSNPPPSLEPNSGSVLGYQDSRLSSNRTVPPLRVHTRHPKYYHLGGDVVFLIENTLFKVHSLQVQPDPGVKNFLYEPAMRSVMNYSSRSSSTPGASDSNPIVLPGVKVIEFVHMLELVLGRPCDKRFIKITNAAKYPDISRPKYGARIMDAGILAMRFGMDQLDSWAQSQISQLLNFSPSSRKENWSQDQIMKLALYIHESRISSHRRDIFESLILMLEPGGLSKHLYSPEQLESNIDACLSIYKHSAEEFSTKSPTFFGYVFIILLSQGPQSSVWKDRLRRKERAVLSSAYASLTSLSAHEDIETDWITDPARTLIKVACSSKCESSFNEAMSKAFEAPLALDSPIPLEVLHGVAQLASARWSFARSCQKWRCASNNCGQKSLAKFDDYLDRLLCSFTEKYKHYAR